MLQLFIIEPSPQLVPLLQTHKDFSIVGFQNVQTFVLKPAVGCDLMVVSAAFPHEDVLELVYANQSNQTPTVISDVQETDPALISLLEAGAVGYLKQGAARTEIIETLCAIYEGKPPLSLTIGTALMVRMHELLSLQKHRAGELPERFEPDLPALTAREREILELIRSGASNQDIARQLTIELGTVKNHVHNILKKLNVSRRDQAALLLDREYATK